VSQKKTCRSSPVGFHLRPQWSLVVPTPVISWLLLAVGLNSNSAISHESHCTLDAIVYARDHGMVLVTFPPHCTHRLQPLDVSVMGPFKTKLSVAQNDWLLNHPGKTITIHDLPALANTAYVNTFTMKNIIAGFAKPGIWPFSRNAFSYEDFEAASVTNRDLPLHETEALPEDAIEASSNDAKGFSEVSYSNNNEPSSSSQIENFPITPEMVRPLPKAEPRIINLYIF
jgi:hypothetical protein